ncbi:MAG TPA: hypothetical protein VFG24_04105 [Nitrosopumilaceae archaeon]|nr:hypothetical protein [Nitrosopumilaceae archaeon]
MSRNSHRAISSVVTLIILVASVVLGTGVVTFGNSIFVAQTNQAAISTQNVKIWINPASSNGIAWAVAGVENRGDKMVSVNTIQMRGASIPYSNWYVEKNQTAVTTENYQSQYVFSGTDTGGMMKSNTSLSSNSACPVNDPKVIRIDFDGSSGSKPMLCLRQTNNPVSLNPGEKMIIYFKLPNGLLTALDSGTPTNVGIFADNAGAPVSVIVGNSDKNSQSSDVSTVFVFLVRTGFPDEPSLISLYQKHARSSDIVAQFSKQLLDNGVTSQIPSQLATTYFSISDIQNNAATLSANGYTWVVYDLESGLSPDAEISDPIGSVQQASQIAHTNGLKFMVTPAGIPLQNFQAMSTYSDGFVLQAQDLINDPDTTLLVNTVSNSVNDIRAGNPNSVIILQGSTIKDTPDQMNTAYDLTKNMVDGITIFYNQDVNDIPMIAQVLTHIDGIS